MDANRLGPLANVADQLLRREVNGDGLVAWTVTEKAENQWFDCIIERMMEILEPSLDKVDVGISNATAMLKVEEMRPILHVFMKGHVIPLAWNSGLHNRNRNARMAGNGSHFPKDLVTTKLDQEMANRFSFRQIASTADQCLIQNLVIEIPMSMAMLREIVIPETSMVGVCHGGEGRNIHGKTRAVAANAMEELAHLCL